MLFRQLLALGASIATAHAGSKGWNSGATRTDGTPKTYDDFEAEFKKSQNLPGTSGWNSIRLYTNIQGGTTADPISAFQAAVDTQTTMLLGIWASAGQENVDNELTALKAAIDQYGSKFTDLVVGISVGSEDLYRISVTGIENDSLPGAGPDVLVNYIKQTKDAISGTGLESTPIGHVDTWDAWTNGTNSAVAENCDWVGMDTYPYFEYQKDNDISNAKQLFWDAYDKTKGAAGGKDVWITETGWPVSGKTEGQGVPSTENAEEYWQEISCELQSGGYNIWWYTLQDALPDVPNPSFGIIGQDINSDPLYSLSCKNTTSSSSSSSASHSATGSASGSMTKSASSARASATASGTASGPFAGGAASNGTAGSASPSGGAAGGAGSSGSEGSSGSAATATSGADASATSGAPLETQTGNTAAKANAAIGAGVLAIFGLVAAL